MSPRRASVKEQSYEETWPVSGMERSGADLPLTPRGYSIQVVAQQSITGQSSIVWPFDTQWPISGTPALQPGASARTFF
jgi:hypothetical protein